MLQVQFLYFHDSLTGTGFFFGVVRGAKMKNHKPKSITKADAPSHARISSKVDRKVLNITAIEKRTLDAVVQYSDTDVIETRDGFWACVDKKYITMEDNKYVLTELGKKARSSQIQ